MVIILDPGLSFGTGHHPTTAFCLQELTRLHNRAKEESNDRGTPNKGFLDAGTGSGILAIAAAKLGFSLVEAFDFDPEALRVARGNAKRNRVAAKIGFFQQDAMKFKTRHRYSFICANLSADVLQKAVTRLSSCLEEGGLIVLAGILAKEFPAVQTAAKRSGLQLLRVKAQKEWMSGAFVKIL